MVVHELAKLQGYTLLYIYIIGRPNPISSVTDIHNNALHPIIIVNPTESMCVQTKADERLLTHVQMKLERLLNLKCV